MTDKFQKLDEISTQYNSEVDFDRYLIEYNFDVLKDHLKGMKILEMGCASGVMTRLLLTKTDHIDIVDGSQAYIDQLTPVFGDKATFTKALFEDYQTDKKYTDILLARALEHIDDPVALLKKMSTWLDSSRSSSIHIVVPNANSLHRKLGVAMGMIPSVTSLSERDHRYGHKRVYTPELLKHHVEESGLHVEFLTGIFLKPLSNAQMETWPRELIDGFYKIGFDYSDSCAEIYLKCSLPKP